MHGFEFKFCCTAALCSGFLSSPPSLNKTGHLSKTQLRLGRYAIMRMICNGYCKSCKTAITTVGLPKSGAQRETSMYDQSIHLLN